MQHHFNNAQDQFGNGVARASVLVQQNGVTSTIYSDDGVTIKANPMTTGAAGAFDFYAANGNYTLSITAPNGSVTTSAVTLFDPDSLSASSGAGMVGYDGDTVQTVLDDAKPMQSYTALRAYTGRATGVRITQQGIAGFFARSLTDSTSADNGGTIIVDGSGRRWLRLYSGAISVKWFGAKGDGFTDDTAAIQSAINWAAQLGVGELEFSNGVFCFTRLFFQYDATNNPGYPATATLRNGQLRLRGKGFPSQYAVNSVTFADVLPSNLRGSILKCTLAAGSTQSALVYTRSAYADYSSFCDGIENLAVIANHTGYIVDFQNGHAFSSFSNLLLYQYGVGSGLQIQSCWDMNYKNVLVYTNNGATAGNGVNYLSDVSTYPDALPAGLVAFDGVSAFGFNYNWALGTGSDLVKYGGHAHEMQAISMRGCQGSQAKTANMLIRGGVLSLNIDAGYFELSPNNIIVSDGATDVTIRNTFFLNSPANPSAFDKHILFSAAGARNFTIENNVFELCNGEGIRLDATSTAITIRNNAFAPYILNAYDFTGQGFGVNATLTAVTNGVEVYDNTFIGMSSNVVNAPKCSYVFNVGDTEKQYYKKVHFYSGVAKFLISKTADYQLQESDPFYVMVDSSLGVAAITLPPTSVGANLAGQEFCIKKTDVSANAVTVTAPPGTTIEGAATYSLATRYKSVTLFYFNAVWYIRAAT